MGDAREQDRGVSSGAGVGVAYITPLLASTTTRGVGQPRRRQPRRRQLRLRQPRCFQPRRLHPGRLAGQTSHARKTPENGGQGSPQAPASAWPTRGIFKYWDTQFTRLP
jgi:hypothetical protein